MQWPGSLGGDVAASGLGWRCAQGGDCVVNRGNYWLIKSVTLENFHFSQRRAVFEISWKELGQDLELRVHIEPKELDEES
jgi:hypothetical protein